MRVPKVLFASFHAYSDTTSGAAGSVRDLFALLSPKRGWTARALAGPKFDRAGSAIREELIRLGIGGTLAAHPAGQVYRYAHAGVPVAAVDLPAGAEGDLSRAWPLMAMLDYLLRTDRPDVLLTFGGGWIGRAMLALARFHGVPSVFWLRNHDYPHRDLLAAATSLCVPSEFSRRHWKDALDLDTAAIPSPIDARRVVCAERSPRCLTFVNPQPSKGAFYFAGIVEELRRRGRQDVPLLVVESRGGQKWLEAAGVDVSRMTLMEQTPDPRTIYRQTKALLVPSLWPETFGRVAAEAMLNGIPVLCSDRGALPDTVGAAGEVFTVAARFTPDLALVPAAEEVGPWVDAIERLFDDPAEYRRRSELCLRESRRFEPGPLAARYDAYLRDLARQATAPAGGGGLAAAAEAVARYSGRPVDTARLPRWDDRLLAGMLG